MSPVPSAHPLAGAYAPVPTPLDGDLRLDRRAFEGHLGWLSAEGLDGALVLGTNGEFASLSLAERLEVAAAAADFGGALKLLLNVGACALPEAVALAEAADRLGYVALLCPPPFYFRSAPVAGLSAFFRTLMGSSALPLLLYHIPQNTGVPVSDALLDALGDHPRLVGVKDSSGSTEELVRLAARFAGGAYLVGHDTLVSAALAAGGAGSISAAASVAPTLVAAAGRDPANQRRLDEVRGLLDRFGLGPAVKAVLRSRGFGAYRTRPPLVGLETEREQEFLEAWRALESAGRIAPVR